ncbi:hypothetical protein BCR44DRAFT_1050750 [Catenaria anguillulae PL171]|uniref:RRM domain-containing protein n=1 Tax=Catenaria anguillulae PL171 TaxID=765915 RepID=A0A1Y2HQZ5_9FUNG|nr:hypothetical protein BCR44DRAFT_1050750 [Catenaria anguillulae PL171]
MSYYPGMMPQHQQQYAPSPNYPQQQPSYQQQQTQQQQQQNVGQTQATGDASTSSPPRHRSIWVGNISEKATRDDLVHLFGSFPGYLDLYYMKQTRSAFVNMASDEAVEEGALHFHGQVFRGSRLICRSRLQKTLIPSSTGNTPAPKSVAAPTHRVYTSPGSVPTPPPMISTVGSASYMTQLANLPPTSQQGAGSGNASSGGQWMLVPTGAGFAYHQAGGAAPPNVAQPGQPPAAAAPAAPGYYPYYGFQQHAHHPGSAPPSYGSPPPPPVVPQATSTSPYPMYNMAMPGAMPLGMTLPMMMQAAPAGPPAPSAVGGMVGDMSRNPSYPMLQHQQQNQQHQQHQQVPPASSSSGSSPQQHQQAMSEQTPASTSMTPRVPPPRVLNQPGGIGWVPVAAYLSAAAQVSTPTGLPAPTPLGIQVPLPLAIPGMGAVGGGSPSNRYFIIKSLSLDDLELSMKYRLWSPQVHLEAVLDLAFKVR